MSPTSEDLGPQIIADKATDPEWVAVIQFADPAAHLNIYFVWQFQTTDPGDAEGGTRNDNTFLEDNIDGPASMTLAHEAGHYFCISPRDYEPPKTGGQLMDKYGSGTKITKKQASQAQKFLKDRGIK